MLNLAIDISLIWLLITVAIVMIFKKLGDAQREDDRYALTELADRLLEDPLETWYGLDPEPPRGQLVEFRRVA